MALAKGSRAAAAPESVTGASASGGGLDMGGLGAADDTAGSGVPVGESVGIAAIGSLGAGAGGAVVFVS